MQDPLPPLVNVVHLHAINHLLLGQCCPPCELPPLANITQAFYKMHPFAWSCLLNADLRWGYTQVRTPQLTLSVITSQARICFVRDPAAWKVPTIANTQWNPQHLWLRLSGEKTCERSRSLTAFHDRELVLKCLPRDSSDRRVLPSERSSRASAL